MGPMRSCFDHQRAQRSRISLLPAARFLLVAAQINQWPTITANGWEDMCPVWRHLSLEATQGTRRQKHLGRTSPGYFVCVSLLNMFLQGCVREVQALCERFLLSQSLCRTRGLVGGPGRTETMKQVVCLASVTHTLLLRISGEVRFAYTFHASSSLRLFKIPQSLFFFFFKY